VIHQQLNRPTVPRESVVTQVYRLVMKKPRQPQIDTRASMTIKVKRTCVVVEEVGKETSWDRLITDDEHVLLSLEFHHHRLKPTHYVHIRLQHDTHQTHIHHSKHTTLISQLTQRLGWTEPISAQCYIRVWSLDCCKDFLSIRMLLIHGHPAKSSRSHKLGMYRNQNTVKKIKI